MCFDSMTQDTNVGHGIIYGAGTRSGMFECFSILNTLIGNLLPSSFLHFT